jgi:organic hydroperoxide reductase OsmC/OhrA
MPQHIARIQWSFAGGDFRKGRYPRAHTWQFDGGLSVPASPSPHVVPAPWSDASAIDPEEAYVAALASCHMMTFLHLASRAGFEVLSYEDEAAGTLAKNEQGAYWVSEVVLKPRIVYGGQNPPSTEEEAELHHHAHEQCFIANSVKTKISVGSM